MSFFNQEDKLNGLKRGLKVISEEDYQMVKRRRKAKVNRLTKVEDFSQLVRIQDLRFKLGVNVGVMSHWMGKLKIIPTAYKKTYYVSVYEADQIERHSIEAPTESLASGPYINWKKDATEQQQREVLSFHQAGFPLVEIAYRLKMDPDTVEAIISHGIVVSECDTLGRKRCPECGGRLVLHPCVLCQVRKASVVA